MIGSNVLISEWCLSLCILINYSIAYYAVYNRKLRIVNF